MARILAILAFLAIGGSIVWYFASGEEVLRVGVTAATPLGDAAKLEQHLVERGLKRFDMNEAELRTLFGDRFADLDAVTAAEYADSIAGMKHRVVLVRAADGRLVGVAARFRSGAKVFSLTGTRCEHFAAVYWMQLAGGKPDFKALMEGGADARDYWLATVTRNGATCTWRKEGAGGPSVITQEIHDTVAFIVP